MIPYEFNPLGLNANSGSGFSLDQGLIFHAPLETDYSAFGGSLYNNPSNYGWIFQTNYFGEQCVYGSSASQGIYYSMQNPIKGRSAFTMSIDFYHLDFNTSSNNHSLFYIGKSNKNQSFGFEFLGSSKNYQIQTAWGDDFVYDSVPNWGNYVNTWTNFTATYDSDVIKIYFNGQLKHTSQPIALNIQYGGGTFSGSYGNLAIGSRWADKRFWTNGLKQMYIYNYALADADVKQFYTLTH